MRSMTHPPSNATAHERLKDAWADMMGTYEQGDPHGVEVAEYVAGVLLAAARVDVGLACKQCGGRGQRSYANTATWRGGVGGCAITADVCDECWGTGRSDEHGTDLRALETELHDLRDQRAREASEEWLAREVGARFVSVRPHLATIAEQLKNKRGDDYWLQRCRDTVKNALLKWSAEGLLR